MWYILKQLKLINISGRNNGVVNSSQMTNQVDINL